MSEKNFRQCKACSKKVMRILDGSWDGINKRWTDEEGGTWNGSCCPPCNRERMKNVMKKARSNNGGSIT